LQDGICRAFEQTDGAAQFHEDLWQYAGGGGGRTRVLQNGAVFEKAAVNSCAVEGSFPEHIAARMNIGAAELFACGISLVLHPDSPMAPTVHMNLRYFEQGDGKWWFGGGADLTPCYPFIEDIRHFHKTLKTTCDAHDIHYYLRFKKWCDDYFFLKHRNERRGVGGIFFDRLSTNAAADFAFVREVGEAFLPAYLPIVERRRAMPYGEREKTFQLIRRARYVEFNLLYDRGTSFGLETMGRVESILVSMPPVARWPYAWTPEEGSGEAELAQFLVPRDWLEVEAASTTGV
jgi:coproporphyrinogen III oxidase